MFFDVKKVQDAAHKLGVVLMAAGVIGFVLEGSSLADAGYAIVMGTILVLAGSIQQKEESDG